jgi:uncharacterized Zn finger protein
MIQCDTCGKEVREVARVVIDSGYNRTLNKPIYNCPECFQKKEQQRLAEIQEKNNSKPESSS